MDKERNISEPLPSLMEIQKMDIRKYILYKIKVGSAFAKAYVH